MALTGAIFSRTEVFETISGVPSPLGSETSQPYQLWALSTLCANAPASAARAENDSRV